MSVAKTKITTTFLIIAFIFTIEYFAQGFWVLNLRIEGKKEVEKCKMISDIDKRTQCFEDYINHRNEKAILGVNGYLVSIIFLTLSSSVILLRARLNQRKKKKDGFCECE